MPTLFVIDGFRFFFFSNEGKEPKHVHVEKAEKYAKFWLSPIILANNRLFNNSELRKIEDIIKNRQEEIEVKWNEYFSIS